MPNRVLTENELKALDFIKKNKFFFSAPFLDQKKYVDWVNITGNNSIAKKLSDSLSNAIKDNQNSLIAEFIEALIGNGLEFDSCLLLGDEAKVINLFDKLPNLCNALLFIEKNDKYIALIEQWSNKHTKETQEMEVKLKPFNDFKIIWDCLNEIKNKGNDLRRRGFEKEAIRIESGLNKIKRELIVLSPLENSDPDVDFQKVSQNIANEIDNIISDTKSHRGVGALLQNLLIFCVALLDVISLTATTYLIPTESIRIKTDTEKTLINAKERFFSFKEAYTKNQETKDTLIDENQEKHEQVTIIRT